MRIVLAVFFLFSSAVFVAQTKNRMNLNGNPHQDFIPDSITAIRVAEAVLLPIFKEEVESFKPFKAKLVGAYYWEVEGTRKMKWSAPKLQIVKYDGKILSISRDK